jgi:hypothetical protein
MMGFYRERGEERGKKAIRNGVHVRRRSMRVESMREEEVCMRDTRAIKSG